MSAQSVQSKLRRALKKAANPARAPQMQKYMKSKLPFYGVPSPQLKMILREVFRDLKFQKQSDWQSLVLYLWTQAQFREERYAALALLRHRSAKEFKNQRQLPLLKKIIKSGSWWDFVDEISSHALGDLYSVNEEFMTSQMLKWSLDPHLWVRRAAIISQLSRKQNTNVILLSQCLKNNFNSREFFINKAMGWALRQYARQNPQWVRNFVKQFADDLSPLSKREALKHL
jgi:3-methyladenine DNA glycosylase AlkD